MANETFQEKGDSLCQIASTILNTPGFSTLLIAELILGTIASLLNILIISITWRVKVFHRNLRILLIHFSFSLFWYSTGYVIKAGLLLPQTFGIGDPCSLRTLMFDCKLQEIPFSIPAQVTIFAELAVIFERLYSTLKYKQYSNDGIKKCDNFPIAALILIFLCYVVPVANILNSLLHMPPSQMVAVCENLLSMTANAAASALANNLIALGLSVICLISLYYWNNHKLQAMLINSAKHTLSSRFQIDQNIQINRIIVPDVIMQLCCFIPNYIFMFLILVGLPLNYEAKTILIHVNYVWKLAYAVAHPALVVKRNVHIRKRIKKIAPSFLLCFCHSGVETNPTIAIVENERNGTSNAHFQLLQEAWNK